MVHQLVHDEVRVFAGRQARDLSKQDPGLVRPRRSEPGPEVRHRQRPRVGRTLHVDPGPGRAPEQDERRTHDALGASA